MSQFCTSYAGKIINVHPADLSISRAKKAYPKYRGKNAVAKAILSGERELRSTIHYVSKEVDCGKIICLSPHIFHVQLNKTPNWHQEQMKLICDGPAMRYALEKLTSKVPQNS
jgi:folate-dependent phosphoribosylglycinamide formyltransferase PurN